MDKRKPTYSLNKVKELIKQQKIIDPNIKVVQSANAIGFSIEEAYTAILDLETKDLYKSTTEHYDYTVWQDVYTKKIGGLPVYIKFKIVGGSDKFLLQSFKEDQKE